MLQADRMQQSPLELPLEKSSLFRLILYLINLPVAFEENGNRHSPSGTRLSINGQAQIH